MKKMRILSLLILFAMGLIVEVNAQVDIVNARANPKTFIFDDDKHTVHGYIYNTLKEQSTCCGNDAIYLEVKFDEGGGVTSAKTLTGKNDCYKKSVVDIVKNVRWDATGVKGTKTIYFEVKPIIPCSGSPDENKYKPIVGTNVVAANTSKPTETSTETGTSGVEEVVEEVVEESVDEPVEEVKEEVVEEVMSEASEAEEVVEEVVEEVASEASEAEEVVEATTSGMTGDGFLSEEPSETSTETGKDAIKSNTTTNSGKDAIKTETVASNTGKGAIKNNTTTTASTPANKYSGPVKIPPQEKFEYVSKGERMPAESHRDSHVNVPGKSITNPKYASGENGFALQIRQALRKAGFCGLAQAAVELTIDPNGTVIGSRVLAANNDKVREIVPEIVSGIKFQPQGYGSNYNSYHQFKTEIVCKGDSPKHDLDQVPNIIKTTAAR